MVGGRKLLVLATQVVAPTPVAAGRFGHAFSFGSSDDAFVAGSPLLQPPTVTVLAWARFSGNPGTIRYIAGQGADGTCSHGSYALYTGSPVNPGLHFYTWTGVATLSPNAGSGMWDGNWHLLAGTYDGASVRLYVDGQQVGSGTPASGPLAYSLAHNEFTIGNYANPAECFPSATNFPGAVDEVRVYDRALSGGELSRLATAQGPVRVAAAGAERDADRVAEARGRSLEGRGPERLGARRARGHRRGPCCAERACAGQRGWPAARAALPRPRGRRAGRDVRRARRAHVPRARQHAPAQRADHLHAGCRPPWPPRGPRAGCASSAAARSWRSRGAARRAPSATS